LPSCSVKECTIERLKTRMILTVHDELLFECEQSEAETAGVVREMMENGDAQRAADGGCRHR